MSPQNDQRDDRHVKLCAYLFGELDGQQAAEVEAALANDPELLAERARLLATIAAVQGAFPGGDELSSASRQDLLSAANDRGAPGAGRHGLMLRSILVAAAAVLLIGAAWMLSRQGPAEVEPREVASNPKSEARPGRERDAYDAPFELKKAADDLEEAEEDTSSERARLAAQTPAPEDARPEALGPVHLESELRIGGAGGGASYKGPGDTRPSVDVGVVKAGPGGSGPVPPGPGAGGPGGPVPTPGSGRDPQAESAPSGPGVPRSKDALVARVTPHASNRRDQEAQQAPAQAETPELAHLGEMRKLGYLDDRSPSKSIDGIDGESVGFLAGMGRKEVARRAGAVHDRRPLTAEQILSHCRRRPNETPSMMYFRFWGDNAFELTSLDRLSTFAVDVDTASYALARNYLKRNLVPEKAQIRTEEFINYFKPDLAPPEEGVFALHLELADSLFGGTGGERWMLRVGLRGREVSREQRKPQRLTFVIDTSGSMKQENRLELVKHTLRLLLAQLDERDQIAIVNFSTNAALCLPMTSVAHRGLIEAALFGLQANGSTNAEAGLKLGYQQALLSLGDPAQHRVILLSDGVANVGVTDQDRISDDVSEYRRRGIYLNTVGVGMGNHNDVFLEQLADQGDGLCNYVDSPDEARRALVDNFTGALIPIARDVKIQVEFDPAQVQRYRLLGYENRAVADRDFRNDAVDAGEVGAGHQVSALFEIEPVPNPDGEPAPLATARVRFKPPHGEGEGDEVTEISAGIDASERTPSFAQAGAGYRRSVLVAQFAEFLRRSTHARGDSLDLLYHEAVQLERELNDPDFTEFCGLVKSSRELILSRLPGSDPLTEAIDAVRRNSILRAELQVLAQSKGQALLDQLEEQNRRLEEQLQKLLEQRLKEN